MRKVCAISAVLVLATAAMAGNVATSIGDEGIVASGIQLRDSLTTFDLTGKESWDAIGDVSNQVFEIDLASAIGMPAGTPVALSGVGYEASIASEGASWLSEARMYFDDNINPDGTGLILTPGWEDNEAGTGDYSSGGLIVLADVGIDNILLPNGILRLEFYEGYDDADDVLDANWTAGLLTMQVVPEPASMILLALGGLGMLRRR